MNHKKTTHFFLHLMICRNIQAIRILGGVAGLVLCVLTHIHADEGRKPIYQPISITQSGTYVLTRDISISTDTNIIDIAASNVTIDLNGRALTSSSNTASIINIGNGAYNNITIKNGYLNGGGRGLYSNTSTRIRIFLENLTVRDTAMWAITIQNIRYVEISGCKIFSPAACAIYLDGVDNAFTGRINNNIITGANFTGIWTVGMRAGEIRGNTILIMGTHAAWQGINLNTVSGMTSGGNLIAGNTISGSGDNIDWGIQIASDSANNSIIDNVIAENYRGIFIQSNNNLVRGNTISANAGNGIAVSGLRNIIEDNQISENGTSGTGFGIDFEAGPSNAYRNNMLRGNASGAVMDVLGNTDAGGNII